MSVNGSANIKWPLYDILRAGIINTAAASWDITIPGVYGVACSETYTGSGNPEGGAFDLYRWGSLTVINSAQGIAQIYIPHTASGTAASGIRYRSGYGKTWNTTWDIILDSTNYIYYTVTKTGTGASGTWGINISGNAATATTATKANQLTTARTISLTGAVTGSGSFDGSGNLSINTTSNFIFGVINSGDDLNNYTTSGIFRINNGVANAPADWGQLLVIHSAGDTVGQLYIGFTDFSVYVRGGNPPEAGGSGAWCPWRKVWLLGDAITGAVWN